ncbi:hypothetical protein ACFOWX_09330 [Sphingorhabdus arenilitoris]|uniref:Uncharacterized protein n=1 Tax=Sphingorhabdus arenilitoris TaxID=1490041 RepID=A0ABV8RGY0_9SPHN
MFVRRHGALDAPDKVPMATATSPRPAKTPLSKRRIAAYALGAIGAIAVIWLIFNFADLKGNARVGTAYAAHITCSCRYIEGRSLDDCAKDLEAGMEMISTADDTKSQRITASVPFLAEAVAEKRGNYGCLILNDDEVAALE